MAAKKRVVLVEGNFDVVSLHQAGFTEVVAPLGTALTAEQVGLLRRLADKVVLLYDGDRAGYKATMHALELCIEADVPVLVASNAGNGRSGAQKIGGGLDDGMDPDSLVVGGGAGRLQETLDRARSGIEFFAYEVWGKATNAESRARALDDAGRLIAKVASPTQRDLIVHTLATALSVDVSVVANAIARAGRAAAGASGSRDPRDSRDQRLGGPTSGPSSGATNAPETPAPPARPENWRPPTDEIEVLSVLIDHPSLIATPEADKAFWLLTDARLRDMYSAARAGQSLLELAPATLTPELAKQVLSGKYVSHPHPSTALANMVRGLEHRQAEIERASVGKSLAGARHHGDRDRQRLLAQLAVAEKQGDAVSVARLRLSLSEPDTSAGKQVD